MDHPAPYGPWWIVQGAGPGRPRARWANPCMRLCWACLRAGLCVPTCVRTSVGPSCTTADLHRPTVGLHHLVHRAIYFELLSYVTSSSGLYLGCSWARWTLFVILDLIVGSMWVES